MYKVGNFFVPDSEKYGLMLTALESGGWHLDHLATALSYVKKFNVALDIGSNVGSWSIEMAKHFNHVHAFELVPETFECLSLNTKNTPNITCHPFGLGNIEENVCIAIDPKVPETTGGNFINGGGDLPVKTLDSLNLSNVDFIKIDVEGYEAKVLEGAVNTIQNNKPIIILEYKVRKADLFGGVKMIDKLISNLNYVKLVKAGCDVVYGPK